MKKLFFALIAALSLSNQAALAEPLLKAEKLADGIFALVGSTGGRLYENLGLNANYGVIDTPDGAVLIDSGASAAAAKVLESEVK